MIYDIAPLLQGTPTVFQQQQQQKLMVGVVMMIITAASIYEQLYCQAWL